MSGETDEKQSAWTTDTLRLHVLSLMVEADRRYTQRFDAQEKAVQDALIAAEKAVLKAETAADARFASVNEFRATLSDQAANLMPRTEAEARLQSMSEKLGEVTDRLNRSEGKGSGIAASWAFAVAAFGMAIGVVGLVLALTRG